MAALQYKDDHNKIAYLGRERGCEDFTDILSYLDHSPLRYALTHAPPVVFDSLVKQFWATAVVRPNAAGSHDLVATIEGREVVVTESLIRTQLHFDDANGIFDMTNSDILEGMRAIGYPTDRALTFLKNHLSPQWRFLVHTLMHCLSPKSGSWNQFPSSIATALLCLSTGRVYNFSRFILEGMIGNVKATKNKFLMYPRFLQMIVAIETADRTPRPTFGFTRKLFANMKFKWEGQPIPLTPPMLAIAAAGDDAADEENAAAHEAAGSTAEAHPEPHSPPVSPVREPTPERQPETEWVVPNPVSPVTDWRPWPSVPAHSPIRDPTPEPASPPTPPAQTFMFEEPLVFGPAPRPAGDVDPDVIESIIFGPQPRPHGYVDPDFVEPIIFGPQPRPDNYLEPEDLDNLLSMEDDTTHGGFHVESPVRPDDAPTPTADAAGRAEDPVLLTSLSEKLDRCMGPEGDVDIQDDVDLDGLSRLASAALGHPPAVPSADVEEREEEEVPLRRKRLRAEDLAQADLPNVSEERAKELDDLMMRMTETDWLNLMMQVGSNPALARELLALNSNPASSLLQRLALQLSNPVGGNIWMPTDMTLLSPQTAALICCDEEEPEWIVLDCGSTPDSDDEIVDPPVKWKLFLNMASSPPQESSSKSEVDRGHGILYTPTFRMVEFKDWRIVSCPLRNISYHVYHQDNRRQKCFTYLKELLPHVYREDLLLLRRRMNRYFRLNPDVDVGLDLWRDVNLLCQSLHSDDVDDFWRTQDEWIVSSWKLYPKSSVHVLDLTNRKTVYMFVDRVYPIRATLLERMLRHKLTVPPSYCRDVFVCYKWVGNVISRRVQTAYGNSRMSCKPAPIACTARQMVFSSPWLTAKKESGSPLQTALVCNSNPLIAVLEIGQVFVTTDWKLLFFDSAVSIDAADLDATSMVFAACFISAVICFCCYSILLLREDLSRNLELTESTPSLGEDCWDNSEKQKRLELFCIRIFISADGLSHSLADYFICWTCFSVSARQR
ncbi:hypothetical protein Tco_0090222 [Tanacetum coccineum]